ncbi:MAG TPA: hypothetical protein DEA55_08600 [Rhodospirillaceae bacterium]|nr:hypothetical protein [Rhodospirillaceae bacterium]
MQKLIEELSSILLLENFRLSKLSPKIFICGGEISDADTGSYISIRDYVFWNIFACDRDLHKRLVRAEDINQWFGDEQHYEDLLQLETDLAGLVTAIPIFVESAGSLAELGSFTVISEICKKLLVFIYKSHSRKKSFIWLGPLRKVDEEKIRIYEFLEKEPPYKTSDFSECGPLVVDDIQRLCADNSYKGEFDSSVEAHRIFLLCDIAFILNLSKKSEILFFMRKLGLDVEMKDIGKYLWVAEKMEMIKKIDKYGDTYYYVPLHSETSYVGFAYREGTDPSLKDRDRWKNKMLEHIEESDSRRAKALGEMD